MGVGRAREPVLPASSRILHPQPSVPECAVCPCPVGDASCISQGPGRGGGRGKLVLVVSHRPRPQLRNCRAIPGDEILGVLTPPTPHTALTFLPLLSRKGSPSIKEAAGA